MNREEMKIIEEESEKLYIKSEINTLEALLETMDHFRSDILRRNFIERSLERAKTQLQEMEERK